MDAARDPVFPIIRPPMALAAESFTSARRSPAPSTRVEKSRTAPSSATPHQPSKIFHEDIFSRLLGGPLFIVHFALYGLVPIYYLMHYSPFSNFESGALNQIMRWTLFLGTMYTTAVLVVTCFGRYQVRKDVVAFLSTGAAVFLLAGMKTWLEVKDVSAG